MFCFKKKEDNKMLTEDQVNNKWPKAPIIYSGRTQRIDNKRIGVDVKTFIHEKDEVLQDIIKTYKLKKRKEDDTAWAIQKWVVKFLTYKYDNESANVPEYWQFPFETVQSGIGDCEDGAILTTALCINAGIPSYRVKVAAGYVQSSPTAPQGGHAYCIYLANDENWRILDWCYYEDSTVPINKKPLAKDGGYRNSYKDVWFTFNDKFSWNQKALQLNGRISNNRTSSKKSVLKESKASKMVSDRVKEILKEK